MSEASPARGQSSVGQRNPAASMSRRDRSSVGNVGGAGSREPFQGLDGVCRRVSRGSARSLAHGAVRVPQTRGGDVGDGARSMSQLRFNGEKTYQTDMIRGAVKSMQSIFILGFIITTNSCKIMALHKTNLL